MVLIISTNGEKTTQKVIEWLYFSNIKFIRINDNDFFQTEDFSFFNADIENISIEQFNLKLKLFNIIWYRKFGFFNAAKEVQYLKNKVESNLMGIIKTEYYGLLNSFISLLPPENLFIPNPKSLPINKFFTLKCAHQAGLNIPNSIICNNKADLRLFKKKNNRIICKALDKSQVIGVNEKLFAMFTQEVTDEVIDNLEEYFFPSLTQELIEKKYEIRSFYFLGKFFSMAIFSQKDKDTEIDYRNYNLEKPNRISCYSLPKEVEEKTANLMKQMNLNTGSIDFIKSKNNEYYFLEINPLGQFDFVSVYCNYYLDKMLSVSFQKKLEDER